MKLAAEDDPRGLLQILGMLPASAEAVVESLVREIAPPVLEADHLYRVESGGRQWLAHAEFQVQYRPPVGERLAKYSMAANLKYDLPIECVLVLLDRKQAPKRVPNSYVLPAGGMTVHIGFRVVRFWEIPAADLIDSGHPRLLPLTILTRATPRDLERAADSIVDTGRPELAVEFAVLGSTRYDKDYLIGLLNRRKNMPMIPVELFEDTWWWKEAEQKGQQQGREEGRVHGLRDSLRHVLKARFPGLEDMPELDRIASPDRLRQLLDAALGSSNPAAVAQAIRDAADAR